ncbi:neuropathy target esterase sws-like [Ptychodera flava]|uniref:neuropathy target esterase sws-like n=1 Tax=Ptychodera flava TaxID=63121 RepID=UPI003969F187
MGSACSSCDGAAPPSAKPNTTLKVDMNQRLDAAHKRRKSIDKRHHQATEKAKKISDVALEEKERLSISVRSSKHRHQNGVVPISQPETEKEEKTASATNARQNAWEEANGNAGLTKTESKEMT